MSSTGHDCMSKGDKGTLGDFLTSKTPACSNIEAAYTRAGGSAHHTPGAASALGSQNHKGANGVQGLGSEKYEGGNGINPDSEVSTFQLRGVHKSMSIEADGCRSPRWLASLRIVCWMGRLLRIRPSERMQWEEVSCWIDMVGYFSTWYGIWNRHYSAFCYHYSLDKIIFHYLICESPLIEMRSVWLLLILTTDCIWSTHLNLVHLWI